jgi:trans-aconitate methyltransferase
MIDWAQKQYPDYPNATFREGSFLDSNLGSFDRIVSFCALQHCSDIPQALSNLKEALKPNGKLLILVPAMTNTAFNQARSRVYHHPKWAEYWKTPVARKFYSEAEYQELLEQSGLQPVHLETVSTLDPFFDKEEMLDWLEGTFQPVVPKELAREFYSDWIDTYLKLDPSASAENGVIYVKFGYLGIEAVSK